MQNKDLNIIFLGTPAFAVPSLEILVKEKYNVTAVITAPDQPAGRGLKMTASAVKESALKNNIRVFQPSKLKDKEFLEKISSLKPDLMVVVAFRMMPQELWQLPRLGTFNLHASLLPQYRGAAPINHAIINGEKETGITTFFLQHEIDTGNILLSEKVNIDENMTAGELHDILMYKGAILVLQTVKEIQNGIARTIPQSDLAVKNTELKTAPKIFKEHCRIQWNKTTIEIHDLIRGLSPHPAALAVLESPSGEIFQVKVYKSLKDYSLVKEPGTILTDSKSFLKISSADGMVEVLEMQLPGKKKLPVKELLMGFTITSEWKAL